MSEKLADLSDTELLGFLMMCHVVREATKIASDSSIRGSFLWARHKSDPDFDKESINMPRGTGVFDRDKNWFIAFVGRKDVPVNLGNGLLLSTFIEGKEKSAYLTIDEILKVAKAIPEGSMTATVLLKKPSDGTLS